jgi:uncharacterized membrane protein (DUF485 family)
MFLIYLLLQEFPEGLPFGGLSSFLIAAIFGNALFVIAAIIVIIAIWRAMKALERLAAAMEEVARKQGPGI